MRSFMYTWDQGWKRYEADGLAGQPLEHVASNGFRNVSPGDAIYVVISRDQQIGLVGRLPVSAILDQRAAERRLRDRTLIEMTCHAVADEPDSTISFTRIVPEDEARTLVSERGTKVKFTSDDEYRLAPMALRGARWLTPASAELLDALLDASASRRGNKRAGAGRGLPQAAKVAVERHAMAVVTAHFTGLGWTVDDVSAYESYDLVARLDLQEKRIEVKGTITEGATVDLTSAEVAHARHPAVWPVLALVRNIELNNRYGKPRATGGELLLRDRWSVDDGKLIPTSYRYVLPERGWTKP